MLTTNSNYTDFYLLFIFIPTSDSIKHSKNVILIWTTNQKLKHFRILKEIKSLEFNPLFLKEICKIFQYHVKMFDMVKKKWSSLLIETLSGFDKPTKISHCFL